MTRCAVLCAATGNKGCTECLQCSIRLVESQYNVTRWTSADLCSQHAAGPESACARRGLSQTQHLTPEGEFAVQKGGSGVVDKQQDSGLIVEVCVHLPQASHARSHEPVLLPGIHILLQLAGPLALCERHGAAVSPCLQQKFQLSMNDARPY